MMAKAKVTEWDRETTVSPATRFDPLAVFGISLKDLVDSMSTTFRQLTSDNVLYRDTPHLNGLDRGRFGPWSYTWDHWHSMVELAVPLDGTIHFRLNAKDYRIVPGHIAFVAPGDVHSESPYDVREPYQLCWIRLKPRMAFLWISEYHPTGLPPFLVSNQRTLSGVDDDLIVRATLEFRERGPHYEEAAVTFLKAFYFTLLRSADCRSAGTSLTVDAIRGLIEERYYEDISVHTIATDLQMNPSYICSVFKHHTGKTIGEYITMLRIRRALELLRSTKSPVNEVAKQCGYHDPYRFSKVFRRETGDTPSRYRTGLRTQQ